MKKSWPFLMIFLILVLFIQACSCLSFIWGSNTVSIYFLAEKKINGGLLLPVDIIVVNDSTGNEIVKTDPDKWFVSDKRKTLVRGKEIFQLAIKGGEFRKDTQIHINEHIKKIIIYANYNKQSSRESQQIILYPETWKNVYLIKLKKQEMEQVFNYQNIGVFAQ